MTKWTKEQLDAIYKDNTNIIVSAGAGSGKTAVLTERVIEKVKKGISLSNLLILTFTKMAAKEMKERIAKSLKDNNLNEELLKIDSADITTFDAYALSLIKKYHYYLNISKNVNVIDSSVIDLYKRKVLRDIFENLYHDKNDKFLSLIKKVSLKDDREVYNYILNLNEKLNLKANKKEYLDNYLNNYFNEEYIDNSIKEFLNKIFYLIDSIRDNLEYIDDNDYLDKLTVVLDPLLSSTTYNEIKKNVNIKLPQARGVSDITKEYKDKISETLKNISNLCHYEDINDIKKSIMSTKEDIEIIIDIIKLLDNKVSKYKEKYNYYEYYDIALLAIKLVKEKTLIRDEIKYNLNEILIDEYQDTNDIQETFISLIANNNVYVVGDIKQSIYRFRNANPNIFKDKYERYSKENNGIKIDLNKNFRSREEVINNINEIFNEVMDLNVGGASYKESHQMIFGNTSYNEVGFNNQNNNLEVYTYLNDTNYKKEEIEPFIVASDILNKIDNNYLIFDKKINKNRTIQYQDIAILVDNSKNFELYKKILEYHNIPTSIVKKGTLTDGMMLKLITNIISYIIKIKNNKFDTEYKKLFISLARSPLFSYRDEVIFDYFANNNFTSNSIYSISLEISKLIDTYPLDEILDIIIDKYDIYNKLILIGNYEENILIIDKLKEITSNLINLDYDIYKYKDYLVDILDNNIKIEYEYNEGNNNAVKIMTIHASKGLEFNICYLISLYSRFNISDIISKFTYDEKYGIIIPYKKDYLYNSIYHDLAYDIYVKENISERIRLLYVALTRAKEKLIVVMPSTDKTINDKLKYKSFLDIISSLNINRYIKNISLNEVKLTRDYNLIKDNNYQLSKNSNKLNVKEVSIVLDEEETKTYSKNSVHLITKEEQENLDYGKKIHELLELIDFKNPNYNNLTDKEINIIKDFISNIDLNNSLNIYKEYEFAYDTNNTTYHGIIDLMIEYDNYIKIIDYKLKNIDDEVYIKQLNGYKEYIENIFNKRVEIYLYSIINNKIQKL